LPYDQCVLAKDTILLPRSMMDNLEPDEWRPIIASSLLLKKTFRKRLIAGMALRIIGFLAVAAVLFISMPILFSQPVVSVDRSGVAHLVPEDSMWL
jgi:hypothetical protein